MEKSNKPFIKTMIASFGFAIVGIQKLVTERNFRIHGIAGVLAIVAGFYLSISLIEWCIVVIVIGLVLTAEAFNSAIEEVCNRITLDEDPSIKRIKDISAAAVLLLAIAAAIVGTFIFLPKIVSLVN